MPDLSAADGILSATIFLYPSVEMAEKGEKFGGSGVLVSVPMVNRPDLHCIYAVSNWHVACTGGASVIRYTDIAGHTRIIEKDPSEWVFIPNGPDLAACAIGWVNGQEPRAVPIDLFASDATGDIFIGEDVFMAGRFVDYDGKDTNRPALRFGAISMLNAPVRQPTSSMSPSHIVDMHSRTGFSGSPVYAYRSQGTSNFSGGNIMMSGSVSGYPTSKRTWGDGTQLMIKLLGLQWGQFPEMWELKQAQKRPQEQASLITDGKYVEGFSGMSCVVPASKIIQLLDQSKLKQQREAPAENFTSIPIPQV